MFENKVKILTKTTYNQVSPRIIFLSKPLLKVQLKDPIPDLNKSCAVYKLNCFCERSYISQASRHLKARMKKYLPPCVLKIIEEDPEIKTTATKNAAKRSSVAENLINNRDCARKYEVSRLKIVHHCNSFFDPVKLEAISIFLKKPELCKQKNLVTKCLYLLEFSTLFPL